MEPNCVKLVMNNGNKGGNLAQKMHDLEMQYILQMEIMESIEYSTNLKHSSASAYVGLWEACPFL